MLDKESDYTFVQEVIKCTNNNKVVLELQWKDCIYNQEHHEGEDSTAILLNNQSTILMMVNPKLLKNIRKSEQVLRLYTNAGMVRMTWEGDIPGMGVLWSYKMILLMWCPKQKILEKMALRLTIQLERMRTDCVTSHTMLRPRNNKSFNLYQSRRVYMSLIAKVT